MSQRLTAFSGGGWHSLSALYGMTAGALDALEEKGGTRDLTSLFDDVDVISANSGGTWALTTLASSNAINDALKTRAGSDAVTGSGYLSQVRKAFEQLPRFGEFDGALSYLNYLMSAEGGYNYNWQPLVEDLTYRPAPDTPNGPFISDQVLNWTEGKPLVFATGLSAAKADGRLLPPQPLVVAQNQQARLFVNDVEAVARSNNIPEQAQLIPLSLELNSNSAPGSIFRIPGSNQAGIDYRSSAGLIRTTTPIRSSGDASKLPLTFPSVMSSAALSPLGNSVPGQDAGNLAPLVGMARGTILSYPSTLQLNNEQEAHASALQRGLIRTMDGGFIDNSSVAYGLSTLQNDQGLNDNFKISSFISKAESPDENWSDVQLNNGESIKLPFDVTMLFGIGLDGEPLPDSDSYIKQDLFPPIMQPNAVLFEADALTGLASSPDWSYQLDGTEWELQQWSINVTTTENKTFDIPAGIEGKISFFILSNPASDSMAFNNDVLDQYDQNYNNYRDALNSAEGSKLIEEAFNF